MQTMLTRTRSLLSLALSAFLPGQREIFYINGADVLPAPLSPVDEAEAIARLGDVNDQDCRSAGRA